MAADGDGVPPLLLLTLPPASASQEDFTGRGLPLQSVILSGLTRGTSNHGGPTA